MSNNKPLNILLVQLFSNGDCLYATTIARQVKSDFPDCRLTWAVAGFCKDIIGENPYVDEIIVTEEVQKNDVAAFRKFRKKIFKEKKQGNWDEVFITHNMDTNLALYDGTIRGMIFRAYPKPVTVPLQPVLVLSDREKDNVAAFAGLHDLQSFSNVILWEFAPQSGQGKLAFDTVMRLAEKLTAQEGVCIILSSAIKFKGTPRILDASVLSVRENAALTHYCTLLIGCSSGLTWISTSSAARFLPMLQLLDRDAFFLNAPSLDFKRYNIPHNGLIEMGTFTEEKIEACVQEIISKGFKSAEKYNEELPLQFNTTKKIVYNLLVYREFAAIKKHFRIMVSLYGKNPLLLKAFFAGLAGSPFKLAGNIRRKLLKRGK